MFSAVSVGDAEALRAVAADDPGAVNCQMTRHDEYRTPLHQAVFKRQHDMLDLLAELGADLHGPDYHGKGPLERAFRMQDAESVARLSALGARLRPAEESPTGVRSVTPILVVADVAASLDYYTKVLGFQIDWAYGDPPLTSCISRQGLELFLSAGTPGPPAPRLLFFVTDVDALHAELVERKARIVEPPEDRAWGVREMRVEDHDGNILRFGT